MNMRDLRPNLCLRLFGLIGLLMFFSPGLGAQEPEVSFQDRLGRLPIRFNGRLTTLGYMARSSLQYAAWKDELIVDGEVLDPVELLLDFVMQKPGASDVPLFRIGDRKVAELCGLDPKEGQVSWHVSHRRLRESLSTISEFYGEGVETPALNALGSQMTPFIYARSWMRVVPMDSVGVGWAAMDGATWPAGKGARYFRRLLLAYESGNPKKLKSSLGRYERWLKKAEFQDPAYAFEVPAGWVELGVRDPERHSFNDICSLGRKTSSFYMGPNRECAGGIVFFSGKAEIQNAENYSRLMSGLAPLPVVDSAPKVFKNPLGIKHEGAFSTHIRPLADLPGYGVPSLVAVWANDAGTWVATVAGPREQLEAEQERFVAFCNSVQVGQRESVLAWLPDEPVDTFDSLYEGTGRTVALLTDNEYVWIIHFYHEPADDELRDRISELLDSILWSEAEGPSTLILGEGAAPHWKIRPGIFECVKAWASHDEAAPVMAIVNRLHLIPDDRWLDATNALCGMFRATPWTQEQWDANRTMVGTDAGEVLLIRRD